MNLIALAVASGWGATTMAAETAASAEVFHVAPEARGDGRAKSANAAAGYLDAAFWEKVSEALQDRPVTVRFADGEYQAGTLVLMKIGHPEHQLVLEPANAGAAIFNGDLKTQIHLRGVQNATLRNFVFTGPTSSFALRIRSEHGYPVRNLTIEDCRFVDLVKAKYGAIGIAGEIIELLVQRNVFKRVGYSAHAHMVYTTYGGHGPGPLRFRDNLFEDSSGDYLRLRNKIGFTEITGNTFISTSVERNRPFIAMPIFNTESPGQEAISDNVLIRGNSFRYHPWEEQTWDRGIAVCLSSYGHDPADRRYLLTPEEAKLLESASVEARRTQLKQITGINPQTLRIFDNEFENAFYQVGFGAFAHFDAESRGWEGFIDISDLVTRTAE